MKVTSPVALRRSTSRTSPSLTFDCFPPARIIAYIISSEIPGQLVVPVHAHDAERHALCERRRMLVQLSRWQKRAVGPPAPACGGAFSHETTPGNHLHTGSGPAPLPPGHAAGTFTAQAGGLTVG